LPEIINNLENVDVIPNETTPFNNLKTYLENNYSNKINIDFCPSAIEDDSVIIQVAT
jgi:hypothetical protein